MSRKFKRMVLHKEDGSYNIVLQETPNGTTMHFEGTEKCPNPPKWFLELDGRFNKLKDKGVL